MKPIELYRDLGRRVSPFLKSYRTDLKLDKSWLLDNPGVPFCHWTSVSSTHLIPMLPHDSPQFPAEGLQVRYLFGMASRWHILEQTKLVANCLSSPRQFDCKIALYCDGKSEIHEVSLHRAEELVEDYVAGVREAWTPLPQREWKWNQALQAA